MKLTGIFLDRDGVLNKDSDNYIRSADELNVYPFAPEAVGILTKAGLKTMIISNQSGIGRGLYSTAAAETMFDKVIRISESDGGRIDDYYYCPHTPDAGCRCRKPGTELFEKAMNKWGMTPDTSVFVGDNFSDYQAAAAMNMKFILVRTGKGMKTEKLMIRRNIRMKVCDNLLDAAKLIIKDFL